MPHLPIEDPDAPYGSEENPISNLNPPQYQDFDMQQWMDMIQALTGQAYDVGPTNLTGLIPWSQGQMEDWFTKMFTGQRGKRVGAEYSERSTGQLNRFAKEEFARRQTQQAEAGGRGSSESALMKVKSKGQYLDALDTIGLNRMNLEESIRGEDFTRGMSGVKALQSFIQGDYESALSSAQFGLEQTQLEANMIAMLANMGMTEAQAENIWNQWQYEMHQSGGVGAGYGGPPISIPLVL